MKITAKTTLFAGLGVAILLVICVAVLIVMAKGETKRLGIVFDRHLSTYERELKKSPYPSRQNVSIERANVDVVARAYKDLRNSLGAGQVRSAEKNPANFHDAWKASRRKLGASARQMRPPVKVSKDFAFGFDYYLDGDLPLPQTVPRLMDQLGLVEDLVSTLYDSGITALTAVKREEFEVDPANVGGGRKIIENPEAGIISTNKLYGY